MEMLTVVVSPELIPEGERSRMNITSSVMQRIAVMSLMKASELKSADVVRVT